MGITVHPLHKGDVRTEKSNANKREKNMAFCVKMPDNSVSLFFLGNTSDKYERQNEADDKHEQNLKKESNL